MGHARTSIAILICLSLFSMLFFLPQPFVTRTVAAANPESGFFEGDVSPRGAYLQVLAAYPHVSIDDDEDGVYDEGVIWDSDGDGVDENHFIQPPLIVDLQSHGFNPGDKMMIGWKQSMYSTTHSFFGYWPYGLFSSTNELLTEKWTYNSPNDDVDWPMIGPLHRVPGAIDVASGGYSHKPMDNTDKYYSQGQEVSTDIPEDFMLSGPVGETHGGGNGVPWTPNTWWYSNCLWVTVPPNAKFFFVAAVSQWMIGVDGTCSITLDEDSDGDAIPDYWERSTIDINKDGVTDLTLPGASDAHKDIFVEVDYMEGHEPMDSAMDDVKLAFSKAPNYLVDNPDKKEGVNLHVQKDEEIIHQDVMYVWEGFDSIKSYSFGSFEQRTASNSAYTLLAKKMTFRYCLFINQFAKLDDKTSTYKPSNSSGVAELPGNDFIVSLGTFNTHGGTRKEQAATFMHELGHTLNLSHGGNVNENYKPNYLSIMNYLFQFEDDPIPNRPLDYSRSYLSTLDENHLDEMMGVSPDAQPSYDRNWVTTAYSDPNGKVVLAPIGLCDWNNNSWVMERDVSADINNFTCYDWPSRERTSLTGYNDWSNLLYSFQSTKEFADGVHRPIMDEITSDMVKKMQNHSFKIHNLAIINVTCSSTTIKAGGSLSVDISVENQGDYDEQANISLLLNSTEAQLQQITLIAGEKKIMHLTIALGSADVGVYLLTARISQAANEWDLLDNNLEVGNLYVNAAEPQSQSSDTAWIWIAAIGFVMAAAVLIAYVTIRRKKG